VGNQSEVTATFLLPTKAATFGIGMMTDSSGVATAEAFVEFVPAVEATTTRSAATTATTAASNGIAGATAATSDGAAGDDGRNSVGKSWSVRVGIRNPITATGDLATRYMPHTDCCHKEDYNVSHHPVGTDDKVCQALCDADPLCKAWVYVIRGSPSGSGDCCLKNAISCIKHGNAKCSAGVKIAQNVSHCGPSPAPGGGTSKPTSALLHLLPSDTELELRVFTDNILIEVFFMGGRVVLTAPIQATEEAGFTAFASESMEVKKVQAWHIKPIWITPAEVANGV
jgi:hypothetical protein